MAEEPRHLGEDTPTANEQRRNPGSTVIHQTHQVLSPLRGAACMRFLAEPEIKLLSNQSQIELTPVCEWIRRIWTFVCLIHGLISEKSSVTHTLEAQERWVSAKLHIATSAMTSQFEAH